MALPNREKSAASSGPSVRAGALAALAAAIAYVPGIDRPFFYDEAQTVGFFIVDLSPFDALRSQRLFNNHPLLSFLDNLVVQLTGRSDEWILRILPIVFAAAAVGVLVGAVHRSWGLIPALCAGLVLASNPMFVEYGRAVRGYSLLVLTATASTVLLRAELDQPSSKRRLAYCTVVLAGLLTHLFMAVVVAIHVIEVLRRRCADRTWRGMWLFIAVLCGAFYASMIAELLDATAKVADPGAAGRPADEPPFLAALGYDLLGGAPVAVAVLGAACGVGLWRIRRAPLTLAAVLGSSAAAVAFWTFAPENVGPRFFMWLVPGIGVAAAAAARRRPVLMSVAILTAALSSISTFAPSYSTGHRTYPEMAELVRVANAGGATTCVSDLSVPALLAYTSSFEAIVDPERLNRCDLLAVAAPDLDERYVEAARGTFRHERVIGAGYAYADELSLLTPAD